MTVLTPEGSKVWPPKGQNITPVNLGNGIRGFYLTKGDGNNTSKYIFWEQDKLRFALGVGGGTPSKEVSQQQLIDTAISAINEPPITNPK